MPQPIDLAASGQRLCPSWALTAFLLGAAACDCPTSLRDVNGAASPGMFSLFGTSSDDSSVFPFAQCEYAATSVFVYSSSASANDLNEAYRNATLLQEVETLDGQPVHVPIVGEQTLVVCIVGNALADKHQDGCAAVRPGPERKVTASRSAYETCVVSDSSEHVECVRGVTFSDPSE